LRALLAQSLLRSSFGWPAALCRSPLVSIPPAHIGFAGGVHAQMIIGGHSMKYLSHRTGGFAVMVLALILAACAGNTRQESTGEYIDDSLITAKVKTALATSDKTKARQIEVETFKGRVQLSGFVDSRAEAETAVQLAREVKGVVEVVDKMTVK
jgi:hypothetical protein